MTGRWIGGVVVGCVLLAACPRPGAAMPPGAAPLAVTAVDTIVVTGACNANPAWTAAQVAATKTCAASVVDSATGQTVMVTTAIGGTFTAKFARTPAPLEHVRITAQVWGVNASGTKSATFTTMTGEATVPDGAPGQPGPATLTVTIKGGGGL